jgi:ferritin-like metal-binding protein YciE
MTRIDSLDTMLVEELRDIYDGERRITKALPKMIKAATAQPLVAALEGHLSETEKQIERLEQAFEALDEPAKAKACAGMRGILEEGQEHLDADYDDDGLRDAAIIGSAQRVEHYEIAAYGTAIAHASALGHDKVVKLLEASLAEEKAADKKLTGIAESVVNTDAASGDADEADNRDTPRRSATGGGNGRSQHARGAGRRAR